MSKQLTTQNNKQAQQQSITPSNWSRGPLFLTCAGMAAKFDTENEQSTQAPRIVITKLEPNMPCFIATKKS